METMQAPPAATGTLSGTLSLLHLRVAQVCMGQKDIRYYLNGIQFELHPGKNAAVLALATDGHRLVVCRHRGGDLTGSAPARFHLERDQVEQVLQSFKRHEKTLPHVFFSLDPAKGMVEITGAGNTRLAFPANLETAASFPSWRRILAGLTPSGRPAQYDPDYLCDCARIARMVNRKPLLHVEHNGDPNGGENHGTARITFGDDNIVMALMPYRMGAPSDTNWLGEYDGAKGWR